MMDRRFSLAIGFALTVATLGAPCRAADENAAAAEVLFRDGRRLMANKNYSEACPKLAESYRLDPATGTLLALGLCYEGAGKTASAWATLTDAATRARMEGRSDRERAARDRAVLLEAKLSHIKLIVPANFPRAGSKKLRILRNGADVVEALWGAEIPVDPGEQLIEARAPGKRAWRQLVILPANGALRTVTVPALAALTPSAPEPATPAEADAAERPAVDAAPAAPREPAALESPAPTDAHESGGAVRTFGLMVGGIGLVSLGVGSYFGLRAINLNADSKAGCQVNACDPAGRQNREDARASGNTATALMIAGGALVGGGIALMVAGGSAGNPKADGARGPSAKLAVAPGLGRGGVGLQVTGAF